MPRLNQKGVAHLLIPIILIIGLIIGVYLVTSGNPLKLFSKAFMSKPTGPETSLTLVGPNECEGLGCLFPKPLEQFDVKLYARSDIEKANLFKAGITFPKDLAEVVGIKLTDTFDEVENYYDNGTGEISLVGGVTTPGLQTQQGGESTLMATITFKAKALGKGTVALTNDSAIYSNLNNINILTIKRNYDLSVEVAPPSPIPSPEITGFEIGIEAGAQFDTSKINLVAQSGAKWVRLNFIGTDWTASSSAVPTYNSIIDAYKSKGINILGLIGAESVLGGYDRTHPEVFTQKYVDAADAIIARFGDRVKTYELFNEPNDWAGGSDAQVPPRWFAEYLSRIYRRIKIEQNKKDIMFNSGPIFSHDQDTGASYLEATYAEGKKLTDQAVNWENIKRMTGSYPIDGIGYHVYVAQGMNFIAVVPSPLETKIKDNLAAVEAVIDKFDSSKKIWISEFGWGTGPERVTEDVQAVNLEKAYSIFKSDPAVRMAMWFTLLDFNSDEWGLIKGNGTKKLAWNVFKKLNGKTLTCTPRPACLDARPRCLRPEPADGWCSTPSATPFATSNPDSKGDGNGDGKINLVDMSIVYTDWMKTSNMTGFKDEIDMNDDKLINTFDFGLHRKLLQQLKIIRVK